MYVYNTFRYSTNIFRIVCDVSNYQRNFILNSDTNCRSPQVGFKVKATQLLKLAVLSPVFAEDTVLSGLKDFRLKDSLSPTSVRLSYSVTRGSHLGPVSQRMVNFSPRLNFES